MKRFPYSSRFCAERGIGGFLTGLLTLKKQGSVLDAGQRRAFGQSPNHIQDNHKIGFGLMTDLSANQL